MRILHSPVLHNRVTSFRSTSTPLCNNCGEPAIGGLSSQKLCKPCQQIGRDLLVNDARNAINAIRTGVAPFDGLADHERLSLLNEVLGDDGVNIRQLGNDQLVQLAADAADEITKRLGCYYEPSPAERQRIEESDIPVHHIDR